MLVQGIKSRPVYTGIQLDPSAKRHLLALEADGANALIEQAATTASPEMSKADILYVAGAAALDLYGHKLAELMPNDLWIAPTIPVLLNRLNVTLATAHMGTRLYVAGTEGFIGQTIQVAMSHGIDFNSIKTEHRGSEARRVQCVHCKGITDNVHTSPFTCSHCGLNLLVRDHYSRRIGAFQGVCVDAEVPGTAPQPENLFP